MKTIELDEKNVRAAIARVPTYLENGIDVKHLDVVLDAKLLANACTALLRDNRELMKLAPYEPCEACGAESGEWCRGTCTERPQPKQDVADQWGRLFLDMITMLAAGIDGNATAAKNYVETAFQWSDGVLPQMPFRRAAITFFRPGGLSPHERAEAAVKEKVELEERVRWLESRVESLTVENFKLKEQSK